VRRFAAVTKFVPSAEESMRATRAVRCGFAAALIVACASNTPQVPAEPNGGSTGPDGGDASALPASHTITITFSGAGTGRVYSTGGEIDCQASCEPSLAEGMRLILVAQPAAGSIFAEWSGACSGSGSCEITVLEGVRIGARFEKLPSPPPARHVVSVRVEGGGSIESDPLGLWCPAICDASFPTGKPVTLEARPFTDWRFAGWSGACSGTGPCTLDLRSDAVVTASFEHVAAGECTGLTPLDPGQPQIVAFPAMVAPSRCLGSAVDGTGALAVGTAADGRESAGHFLFLPGDGGPGSTRDYAGLRDLHPQQRGFAGIAVENTGYGIYSLAPDGAVSSHFHSPTGFIMSAADPRGGTVVVDGNSVDAFDSAVRLRWSAAISDIVERRFTVGADSAGHVLLLFDGEPRFGTNTVAGIWITADGRRGDVFEAVPFKYADTWLVLWQRIGGGFFVEEFSPLGSQGKTEIESLATSTSPGPRWLLWTPHPIHGERAYALLPSEIGAYSPACTLQIATTSGTRCGTITFDGPSGRCDASADLRIGIDGTLVQSIGIARGCTTDCVCTWRVWRGYLR